MLNMAHVIAIEEETTNEAAKSDLDVNAHHQDEAFEDKDHDTIEDLSVDPELAAHEAAEHHDDDDENLTPVAAGKGGIFPDLLKVDENMPDEYDEEVTTADGKHYKKHVRKGHGFQEV